MAGASAMCVTQQGRELHKRTLPPDPGPKLSAPLIQTTSGGGAGLSWSRFPVAFRPPAFASWPSCPAREFSPPYGRLTAHRTTLRQADPDKVSLFRTHETRLGWVPSVPRERRCSHDRSVVLGRRLPPHNGTVPATLVFLPAPESENDEASSRIHDHSPVQPSPHL